MTNSTLDELAVYELLLEDLRVASLTDGVEMMQLQESIAATTPSGELVDGHNKDGVDHHLSDLTLASGLSEKEIEIARDQAHAQILQSKISSEDVTVTLSRQYAQRLAAAETKIRLDSEFAMKLQAILDDDCDANHDGYDADRVLGKDVIEDIFASNPNSKGKGIAKTSDDKGKGRMGEKADTGDEVVPDGLYPECGICGDVFHQTNSPLAASQSANTSTKLPFGLRLPCPSNHAYCIGCLSQYIISKLDPESSGKAPGAIVFPIRCPECSLDEWPEGLQDETAEKVLTKEHMVTWYHQQLLDSQPHYYCPNPKCSALIHLDEERENAPATCPLCQSVMCTYCKTLWHEDLLCSQYQSLPLNERSPEDRLLIVLAKEKKWRQCPNCRGMIERIAGCNHMECRCGAHFCFQCGGKWDTNQGNYKCLRGCELWEDDEQLLDEDQREGRRLLPQVDPPAIDAIELPNVFMAPPPYNPLHYQAVELEWIYDDGSVSRKHPFTREMIDGQVCGYCGRRMNTLAGLRAHLAQTERHPVFACCGKFYRLREHYIQHRESSRCDNHNWCVRNEYA